MTARLVVITGTGTGIGKTHAAEAILRAAATLGLRAAGLKPIETGISDAEASDVDRLHHASTFHVELPGYYYAPPISPHLAARDANHPIDIARVAQMVQATLTPLDLALVELPGGLFTPITDAHVNVDLALALNPHHVLVVAPDRLGVLHDVIACARAAKAAGITIDSLILMPPPNPDASTGRNKPELQRLLQLPTLLALPQAPPPALARNASLLALLRQIVP